MKIIIVDGMTVQYAPSGTRYTCHVVETELFFSSKDIESIEKKARVMIQMREKFLKEYPEYRI